MFAANYFERVPSIKIFIFAVLRRYGAVFGNMYCAMYMNGIGCLAQCTMHIAGSESICLIGGWAKNVSFVAELYAETYSKIN